MAIRCSAGEGVTLIESCSGVSNTLIESALAETSRSQVRHHRNHGKWRKLSFRSIGSRSILLILAWQFIIRCAIGFAFNNFNQLQKEGSLGLGESSVFAVHEKYILGCAILSCVLIPIVTLLAEVVIGRYRLVSYSLKAMWLLSIVGSVFSICEKALPVAKIKLFTIQWIVLATQYLLQGAFIASAVPLGIDQIIGGSSANISAYLQWLGWTFVSGETTANIIGSILHMWSDYKAISVICLLLPVFLLSVALILDFSFHHKLVKEPVTVNPVSLTFKVLKYAAKHKFPVQRSAFTYCENEQPTRLDYGKSKYGGPFTTEQVEDVKTFWRVLLVILVSFMLAIPLTAEYVSVYNKEKNLSLLKTEISCVQKVLYKILTPEFHIIYLIPLYELLIYPCLRNRGPSIFQSAGIGAAALIISSVYSMIVEVIRKTLANGTNQCSLSQYASGIEIIIDIPSNFMMGFTAIVLPKSSIEFVCAQAPYNMMGVLIGLSITILILFMTFGTFLFEAFKINWLHTSICGIWFYLTTLVLVVVTSVLLGLVIRWYKARERDEITRSQNLVEEVYQKYWNKHTLK